MKITGLFLLFGCLHCSATSLSQTITINVKEEPLPQILESIRKQTSYKLIYSDRLMGTIKPVSIAVKNMALKDFLNTVLYPQSLVYEMKGKTIFIWKELNELPPTPAINQNRKISGTIQNEKGTFLEGVNVSIKGGTSKTASDQSGRYQLEINNNDGMLVFSLLGYEIKEVNITKSDRINVIMLESVSEMDEVVVVGYGTQRKSDLTGSIVSADLDALKGTPNLSLMQGLQGTVPGLNVGMVDEAGENPTISIRGRTSISGNQSPLIILDGIIYYGNLSNLNPNDLKSVEILKDASSKAIYGAQAANGVILITSKKGLSDQKPLITYNGSYSFGEPAKKLHTRNRESYLQMIRDIFWQEAYTEASGYTLANENYNILASSPFTDPYVVKGYDSGADINWWDFATHRSNVQRHDIGLQGSSSRSSYYMSLAYDDQDNYIINDTYKRKTARINLETQVTDWLKVGAQTFGAFSDYSGESPNLTNLTQAGPFHMPYDETGKLLAEWTANPLIPVNSDDLDKRNELFGNLFTKVNVPFIKGLSWNMNYGNTMRWTDQYNSNSYVNSETGQAQKVNSSGYDYTLDNIINYVHIFHEQHQLDATYVIGKSRRTFESTTALAKNLANQTLGYNDLSQGINQFTSSDSWEESAFYQMLRINYSFKSRYLLTATLRKDGFSGFAKNEKTAYFPSLALGWNLSEEPFIQQAWLDQLKVRASYGINGNLVSRYSSLATVLSEAAYVYGDGGTTAYGHSPSSLPNPNLKWERTHGINLGLDFAIFKNRIKGNVEYYQTTTRDLIWNKALPILTGFGQIIDNIGEIRNNGIELMLTLNPIKTPAFNWNLSFNFSKNNNKIAHLLGDVNGDGKEDDLLSSNLFIGQPIGAVYNYKVDGIYQLGETTPAGYFPGSYKINDHSNDGVLSAADRTILGMTDPLYRFSFNNSLTYKQFSLKVFVNSIQGGKSGYLGANEPFGSSSPAFISQNGIWEEIDFWTPTHTDARFRSPSATSSINPALYQSRSFVRLQDVTLSYNFEKSVLDRIKVAGLMLNISGKNLYTWTNWEGWDPETGSGLGAGGRPIMRYFTLGLELTL